MAKADDPLQPLDDLIDEIRAEKDGKVPTEAQKRALEQVEAEIRTGITLRQSAKPREPLTIEQIEKEWKLEQVRFRAFALSNEALHLRIVRLEKLVKAAKTTAIWVATFAFLVFVVKACNPHW